MRVRVYTFRRYPFTVERRNPLPPRDNRVRCKISGGDVFREGTRRASHGGSTDRERERNRARPRDSFSLACAATTIGRAALPAHTSHIHRYRSDQRRQVGVQLCARESAHRSPGDRTEARSHPRPAGIVKTFRVRCARPYEEDAPSVLSRESIARRNEEACRQAGGERVRLYAIIQKRYNRRTSPRSRVHASREKSRVIDLAIDGFTRQRERKSERSREASA